MLRTPASVGNQDLEVYLVRKTLADFLQSGFDSANHRMVKLSEL